jgi:hypothetical protein
MFMKPAPPEFAVAGLDPATQLYQLTQHVHRLRRTVNRMWMWIGALVFLLGVPAAFAQLRGTPDLVGKSLVLEGSELSRTTIRPASGGLGIQVSDKTGSVTADLLLKTQGNQVALEKNGRVIWASP